MSNLLPIVQRAKRVGLATAIVGPLATYTYAQLVDAATRVASGLLGELRDLEEARVAILAPPALDYVAALLGVWQAGGVAVPMCRQHPAPELAYVLDDAQPAAVLVHPDYEALIRPLAHERSIPIHSTTEAMRSPKCDLPAVDSSRRAMMLYTSGTTGKPRGVVTTHQNVEAQITTLVDAWQWTSSDHILHVLPLHHVHGIINALCCALWSGATCEFQESFDAPGVWERMEQGGLTLFMGVPTTYAKLIAAWEQSTPEQQRVTAVAAAQLRLMVSGSAALPVSTLEAWKTITGHVLLERYGMTEIGMALSNPLHGERVPGHVGAPLPGVDVRLVDEEGALVSPGEAGEIEVRGPSVFLEYWNRPEETASAFHGDWFRTGDVAVEKDGIYRILGRQSVDIIETGGYKVSALEIEEVLREHPAIGECAVVGVEDDEWGQRVSACVVLVEDQALALEELRKWAKDRLAAYKVPKSLLTVDELPRNSMGKVQKPAIVELFC